MLASQLTLFGLNDWFTVINCRAYTVRVLHSYTRISVTRYAVPAHAPMRTTALTLDRHCIASA